MYKSVYKTHPVKLKLFINNVELKKKYEEHIKKHNYDLLLNEYPDSGFDLLANKKELVLAGEISKLVDLNISAALYEEDISYPHAYCTISISASSSLILLYFMNASVYMYILLCLLCAGLMWLLDEDQYTTIIKERPVSFKIYPRSSMGSKTPLRLANSVGVIDSGYRGNLKACIDCYGSLDYTINEYDRLVQIVAFSGRPIFVKIVDNLDDLGKTIRMDNGFGSTGK